jgi:hypothetical protein
LVADKPVPIPTAAQTVATRVFNKTSSVMQTPVERQWGDTNLITRKFKEHFRLIEASGDFDTKCASDIFSLTAVYMPEIVKDVDDHYEQMRMKTKKADTSNPDYPKGTSTRLQLYEDYENMKEPLTADEIDMVARIGDGYWAHKGEHSPWEVDPLTRQEDRDLRFEKIEQMRPMSLF